MKVIIEADGGSRGNPGVAGCGTVVYDANHQTILREIAFVVGKASNNVAEYQALINGLEAARELGATEVDVSMDSKLVIEQMSGRWKIKHPDMKDLALKAQAIARDFQEISYKWIPRSQNSLADSLANKAMDACAAGAERGPLEEAVAASAEKTATHDASWLGASMKPTRFILLRHGQTPMSAAKQYSGSSDPELSELGQQQAEAAAARLSQHGDIDVIVSSPARRARQTAAMVAERLDLPVEINDSLRELDFGDWEGKTFAEVHATDAELHQQWLQDTSLAAPGGESVQAVARRTKKLIDALAQNHQGKNILLVSHVTPIKCVLKQALGAPPSVVHKIHLGLASISIAEFYSDGPTLVRLMNDTAHL